MKKITFAVLGFAAIVLTSCLKHNDNDNNGFYYDPFFVAERNGLVVYAYPGSAKIGTDSISVFGVTQEAGVRMRFRFRDTGTYVLSGNQAKYYQLLGKDTVSRYNIGAPNGSSVQVTAYDSVHKVIAGRFTLKFKRTFPATSGVYADSVKFSNGKFVIALPR